mmetsp:Transcript_11082/g.31146  ORF Transcript_11082/g.31146 Transcript_11082/m.31146 type:complete len:109 (-) Transcript_11082:62-388(-)
MKSSRVADLGMFFTMNEVGLPSLLTPGTNEVLDGSPEQCPCDHNGVTQCISWTPGDHAKDEVGICGTGATSTAATAHWVGAGAHSVSSAGPPTSSSANRLESTVHISS